MERIRYFDWFLQAAVVLLLTFSVAVIFAITFGDAGSGGASDAVQQLFIALLGLGIVAVIGVSDYRVFRRTAGALYLLSLFFLILVELVGVSALGATRWIDLGFFQFQPSEFAKLVMVVVLAKVFADHQKTLDTSRTFFKSLAYTMPPVLLVAAQPDLGTAMVLMSTWLGMTIAAGLPKRFFVWTAGVVTALLPVAWLWLLQDYQKRRIMTLIDPMADPLGAGYNVQQAQIAVGSGGIFGRTLGSGSQSQLNFLPIQHTDFIFAVIAEELGFFGALLLLGLLAVVIYRSLAIARGAHDFFGYLLAMGIMLIVLIQTVVNIGMNTGIMPVTGIPLPFVSYGGTSILMLLLAVGILQSIASSRSRRVDAPTFAG
ncbi:MAG: rod shape-determining protein RodA [Patescibacteria group bacterium]